MRKYKENHALNFVSHEDMKETRQERYQKTCPRSIFKSPTVFSVQIIVAVLSHCNASYCVLDKIIAILSNCYMSRVFDDYKKESGL